MLWLACGYGRVAMAVTQAFLCVFQVLPGSFYPPLGSKTRIDWTEYHEFALEWDETSLRFFVDGVNYHNKTSAQVHPASLCGWRA